MNNNFLPTTKQEMLERGWYYLDFLLISGDAYVDHPSFGAAIIGRLLESQGYKVGILAQPDVKDEEAFLAMGKPGLAVLITSGNMDSMLNHYSATKNRRKKDNYSPGGKIGLRPDYAVTAYGNIARKVFGKTPIIIGGVEASLRRFAHYDFWSDKVLPSALYDSKADILVYGMAELAMKQVSENLKAGKGVEGCKNVAGICYLTDTPPENALKIPSLRQVKTSKAAFADAFVIAEREQNHHDGKALYQQHNETYLVQNPPARPLTMQEMDTIYSLPYTRNWHPKYDKDGGIPAFADVKFSAVSHRGCFGGCSFCALNFHQGRIIQNRSDKSILEEIKLLTELPDFKGNIYDIGGPTANFRLQGCDHVKKRGACKNRQCLYPSPCKNLRVDHRPYAELLKKAGKIEGVKRVFIRSGLRYDYLLMERRDNFMRQLCQYHISGQLKVAPEHIAPEVLDAMGKPQAKVYRNFVTKFEKTCEELGKEQYLIPYFIAAHPGSTNASAIQLAASMKANNISSQQVQLFIPTPGSRSTAMYYTGLDPYTKKPIFVPKKDSDREEQRALLQYWEKENQTLVRSILEREGREELIGRDRKCLVPQAIGKKSDGKTKDKPITTEEKKNTAKAGEKSFKNKKNAPKTQGKTGKTMKESGKNTIKTGQKTSKNNTKMNQNTNQKISAKDKPKKKGSKV